MKFLDLGSWFLPHNHEDIKDVIVWRNKVAYTLAVIVLVGGFLMPTGLELRYVDKVEAAEEHGMIEQRLAGVEAGLKTLSDQNQAEAIRDIRLQIYTLRERACKATGELRNVLNEQVQDLRTDYQAATNSEFPVISCAELTGIADEE